VHLRSAHNRRAVTNPQDGKARYGPKVPTYVCSHHWCYRMCQVLSADVHFALCHALADFRSPRP